MVGSLDLRVSPGGKVNDLVGHGAGQAAVLPHFNRQTLSQNDQLLSSVDVRTYRIQETPVQDTDLYPSSGPRSPQVNFETKYSNPD